MRIILTKLREANDQVEMEDKVEKVCQATFVLFEDLLIERLKKGKNKALPTKTDYLSKVKGPVEKEIGKLPEEAWDLIHANLTDLIYDYMHDGLNQKWGTSVNQYEELMYQYISENKLYRDGFIPTKTAYVKYTKNSNISQFEKERERGLAKLIKIVIELRNADSNSENKWYKGKFDVLKV